MTTYNTGNPVPSTAVKDLYDNSQTEDEVVNSDAPTTVTRTGKVIKTFAGFQQDFDAFLLASGYEFLGDYDDPGELTFTRANQMMSKDGEFWRPSASLSLPYTTVNNWAIDQPKFVAMGDAVLRQDLAAPGGSALIEYKGRDVEERLGDVISIMDADGANPGAAGTGGNDLVAVQHKIDQARPLSGSVLLPTGKKFMVTSKPTNPTGVPFVGDGKVGMAELGPGGVGTGFYQFNTKFDREPCIGREYLYRPWSFIHLQDGDRSTAPTGGPASDLRIYLFGDSTAVGYVNNVGPTPSPNLAPNLAPNVAIVNQLNNNGVRYCSVFQRAVSGTSWADLNAIPDISATTALFIIKYGINDAALPNPGLPVDQRIANMATVMRAKLAAIRAVPSGALSQLGIILVGPTATADSVNGRNEEFFEQVRDVYIQAARDYQCCYIDPYPFLRDARTGGLLWMDQPYGGTETGNTGPRTVHMTDTSMNVLWAWIVDQAFPREALLEWGSTSFRNIGNNSATFAVEATGPLGYRAGETWQVALVASGFPIDGRLQTLRWADGQTKQILHPFATSLAGGTGTISRTSTLSGLTFLARWTGIPEALTLVTGWVTFAPSTAPSATLGDDGWVDLIGSMKSGTIGAGTLVTTLPVGMRPPTDRFFVVSTNAGVGSLTIQATGQVLIAGGGDATRMNLDGIRFKAA